MDAQGRDLDRPDQHCLAWHALLVQHAMQQANSPCKQNISGCKLNTRIQYLYKQIIANNEKNTEMISNIKIFKRYEDSHGGTNYSSTEPLSPKDYDFSISHTSYNILLNQINKSVNELFFEVKVLHLWQKQGGQTLDITSDTYAQILSNVKINVLLKVQGKSSQEDLETIMRHFNERIKNLERMVARSEKVEETARRHAKHGEL